MSWEVREGDALARLREMPGESVQTVVTSPPYWGLRDYGTANWEGGDSECGHRVGGQVQDTKAPGAIVAGQRPGVDSSTCLDCGAKRIDSQLGLEPTPEQFVANLVAVFREVRRVLRKDGTVWLNLGDSYAATSTYNGARSMHTEAGWKQAGEGPNTGTPPGLKPKDLCGVPWSVAKALQAPQYVGRIAAERDRVWLAATLDAEGTICGFTHERKDNGAIRTGVHVNITNSDTRLLDEANRIWPASRSAHLKPSDGHLGERDTWRWIAHGAEDKQMLMRELHPYLIGKQKQALLAHAFFGLSINAKRLARSAQAQAVKDKRAWIVDALSRLNHGEDVDVPSWVDVPPSLHEQGWWLRSDIIWSKPNPMPESVTDRPTRAHEYLFLLTKSARYFYDADAIREPHNEAHLGRYGYAFWADGTKEADGAGRPDGASNTGGAKEPNPAGRNRRSVWEITTQPYPEAHFATFPPKLVEPCILAGSPPKCCGECGSPWERVTKAKREWASGSGRAGNFPVGKQDAVQGAGVTGGDVRMGPTVQVETLGWRSTCDHDDDSGRSVVLDPFAGSGTTGVVALRHDRSFIGIELSADYCELARNRIRDDAPLLNTGLEVAA